MVERGKLTIFRMTDTTDTENNISADKVEFDGDAQIPDSRSGTVSFSPVMSRTPTENPAPFQEIARKPDTGFSGNRYTLQVFFDEEFGKSLAIAKIRDWHSEENAIKGKFKEGRFGIRNDYRPEYDLTPNNDAGYKLIHFETTQELVFHKMVRGTIVLEFSGDPSQLG